MQEKDIEQFEDNEWYRPKMKGFIHECCDCGLKHKVDFKIWNDDGDEPYVEIRFKRLEK